MACNIYEALVTERDTLVLAGIPKRNVVKDKEAS
jgi:hypothetical protein